MFNIKEGFGGILLSLALLTPVHADENTYTGLGLGTSEKESHSASAFAGYETDFGGLYAAAEAGFSVGYGDNYTIDAKVGLPVHDKVTGYGIVGYGGNSEVGGWRYGIGGKYDINSTYFAGVDAVWQNFDSYADTSITARVGIKF